MSLVRDTSRAIRSTLVLWLITAILYPLLLILLGQLPFLSDKANGSLLKNSQGAIVGSALIGQPFASERYFWSRPSTSSYSTADPAKDEAGILKTGVSGASNLAPSNPALIERILGKDDPDPTKKIEGEVNRLKAAGITPTADMVYTSGSSLDPHITPESALAQVERVAKSRNLPADTVQKLIADNTDRRFLSLFGEDGVNVLKLNLALDNSRT